MVPAARIVQLYQQEEPSVTADLTVRPEDIQRVVNRIRTRSQSPLCSSTSALDDLLRFSPHTTTRPNERTTLQLGGRDPHLLALASAIGSAYGYTSVNLNCGCPHKSVSG